MENKLEDEIVKRWEVEAKEKEEQEARPKKRVRALEYGAEFKPQELLELPRYGRGKGKAGAKKPGARKGMVVEEDAMVVELD